MQEGRSVATLLYHHVGPVRESSCRGLTVTPQSFARQIATMSAMGYTAILPDDWGAYVHGEGDVPDRCVMITFDDAYSDLVEHAFPVLERHRYPATVFVPTSLIGKSINCNPDQPDAKLPIMSEDEIRHWSAKGVTFGAHSRTHADLTSLDRFQLDEEIEGSKDDLARITGQNVTAFAYPYGHLNQQVEAAVASHYRLAFTAEEGLNDTFTRLTALNRTMVQHKDTVVDVLLRARYGKSVLQRIRQTVTARD
jgi:peptidoglycan/xylan/chitin deacetylase (PgdA/CDA1 family)